MQLLEKAIELALQAHAGAKDKSGNAYVLHPLRLMIQMDSVDEQITAVLHDVIEDSALKLEDISAAGMPQGVIEALALLTHDSQAVSYEDYISALKPNALARKVKLADLKHNMDIRRLPQPLTERDFARLTRYRQAWDFLSNQ